MTHPTRTTASPRTRRRMTALSALGVLVGVLAAVLPAGSATGLPSDRGDAPANASFEDGLTGWQVRGERTAAEVLIEDGDAFLRHRLDRAGQVVTGQPVVLGAGWQTVSADVRAGGELAASTLRVTGCRRDAEVQVPATESDDAWVRVQVSVLAGARPCRVELATEAAGPAHADLDDLIVTAGRSSLTWRGADLSGLAKNEAYGARYLDADGQQADPVRTLAAHGANLGRLKVWVDPADGWNTTEQVVATARRMDRAGMAVLVDFHYSDRWTDPAAQQLPAAWEGLAAEQVADELADHTREVLTALRRAGITPWGVQIGNEINPGMLWPLGQTWDVDPDDDVSEPQWDNLAMFLDHGSQVVREVFPESKVLLHLTNINDGVDGLTWWFDEITARGVDFDTIGLSYYSYWHGSLADLQQAIRTLGDRYDREVVVVETSYPWTLEDDPGSTWENVIDSDSELTPGYPATPEGQAASFRAVQDATLAAGGTGVVYWEPAWTAVEGAGWDPEDPSSGNAWENQAVFDHEGRPLPAIEEFRWPR